MVRLAPTNAREDLLRVLKAGSAGSGEQLERDPSRR